MANKKILFVFSILIISLLFVGFVSAFRITITGFPIYEGYGDSLISVYQFNDSSYSGAANEVRDSVGGRHGTASSGATIDSTQGIDGKSVKFDGARNDMKVNNFVMNSDYYSMSFWFNTSDVGTTRRIVEHSWSSGTFTSHIQGGRLFSHVNTASGTAIAVEGTRVEANKWYHIVVVFDGALTMYKNGIKDGETIASFEKLKRSTANLLIGSSSYKYIGNLDELMIFNKSLSASEVSDLYRNQNARLNRGGVPGSIDGVCGAAAGQNFTSTPTANLCSAGTATLVTLSDNIYFWTCLGIGTGSYMHCRAYKETITSSYSLEVIKIGTGTGTVVSRDRGINCGSDCSQSYEWQGTHEILNATPDSGSVFSGWTGCFADPYNKEGCYLSVNGPTIVYANFTRAGATPTCAELGYNTQNGEIARCAPGSINQFDLSVCSNVTKFCDDKDDFDSGLNYYEPSYVSFGTNIKMGPSCNGGSPSGGSGSELKDTCMGLNVLKEAACNDITKEPYPVEFSCPYGCETNSQGYAACKRQTTCPYGCIYDGKCVPYAYRKSSSYCDVNGIMQSQRNGDALCDNNHECMSNVCSNGKCVDVSKVIQQTSAFRKFVVDVLCFLKYPLDPDTREICADNALTGN